MTLVRTFLILLLVLVSCSASWSQPRARLSDCPHLCHCEEDGTFLRADCADLGLQALPSAMSIFISYLDLSMNNISQLPSSAFSNLHFLEELRLAGNQLRDIPQGAFDGLVSLQVLMLQNNRLEEVPARPSSASTAFTPFQIPVVFLTSRLDANHISRVPQRCFEGLSSLRHLWLDDNVLTEVPTQALGVLSSLQAMTLALNHISHIPDQAFANLSSLVVLHVNNNRVVSMGKHSFSGLHSLETLDLNYNHLEEFPVAIRSLKTLKELGFHHNKIQSIPERAFVGNPSLLTILFYDNPIHFVGKSAFQHLPELQTLSLNGAADITEFPDLTGTHSLERLTITGARITSLPTTLCGQLPNLQMLDLSYNLLKSLPSLQGCERIQKIDLHHNQIQELRGDTFRGLTSLKTLHLGWNELSVVDPLAFSGLAALTKLDLSSNQLTSLPTLNRHMLTHLKLAGNADLQELLPVESFTRLRVVEMPYAFQCCAFLNWEKYGSLLGKGRNSGERDLEDMFLDSDDEPPSHLSVQCSPAPGPFQPCAHLFGSWLIRAGVWIIAVLSLVCNALVMVSIFLSPTFLAPVKLLVGLLALVNSLMGLCSASMALVDTLTFGSFASYGSRWQSSASCKFSGLVSVFASETGVFLLTAAAMERGFSVRGRQVAPGSRASPGAVKLAVALCFLSGLVMSAVPLLQAENTSSLCLPLPQGEYSALGFAVTQVLVNSLCYLTMTIIYTRLYCSLEGAADKRWDCAMVRHVAWLLFANCVLYFPVASLSFSAVLRLPAVGPGVVTLVLLVVRPLPACINPLLYVLFNHHFKEDLGLVLQQAQASLWRTRLPSRVPLTSEDAEKQSWNSAQALVPAAGSDKPLVPLGNTSKSSHLAMHCVCTS